MLLSCSAKTFSKKRNGCKDSDKVVLQLAFTQVKCGGTKGGRELAWLSGEGDCMVNNGQVKTRQKVPGLFNSECKTAG